MHPDIFIFSVHIHAYTLFVVLACVVTIGGSALYAHHRGFAWRDIMVVIASMSVAGVCGARLLYVVTNSTYYSAHPEMIVTWEATGFALTGGIISALIVALIVTKVRRMNLWKLGDTMVPFLGVGIATARIGCYLNGCCYGHATNMPWGVHFPLLSEAHLHQLSTGTTNIMHVQPVHPTELYEMVAALVGVLLAIIIIRKRLPDGTALLAFGLWFALFRLINHPLRVVSDSMTASAWMYVAIYITTALFCGGLLWHILHRKK